MSRSMSAAVAIALALSASPALAETPASAAAAKPNEVMLSGGYLMLVGGGLSYRREVTDLLSVRLLGETNMGSSVWAATGGPYQHYGIGLGLLTNGWLYGGASANLNHVPGAQVAVPGAAGSVQGTERGTNVALNLVGGVRGEVGPVALAFELRLPAYHQTILGTIGSSGGGNTPLLNLMAGHRF